MDKRICIGKIVGAHGIRGEVKIHSYADDPMDMVAYGTITNKAGTHSFDIHIRSTNDTILIASIAGVTDRNTAESLRNTELFIDRNQLPVLDEADAFYVEDLKGLSVVLDSDASTYGTVKQVHNFGASDILEIETCSGKSELFALSKAIFPTIDVKAGRMTIILPLVDYVQESDRDQEDQ